MKKIITILTLTATLAGTSAFGQGFFKFASGKSQTWDGTGASALTSTKIEVALLWAAASTASPFAGAPFNGSTPTSGNNTTSPAWTDAAAQTALSGSSFTFANSASGGGLVQGFTLANGSVSLAGGGNFDIIGTSAATIYTLMLVSWDRQYSTFAAAAAAPGGLGAIGWSTPIQVTSGSSLIDNTVSSPTIAQFGTFAGATPEPGTMAIAALGGASLLLFRRKK